MRLKDRVAIVTGSGRGIGRRIATRFASEGAAVVIAEINAETGASTCQLIKVAGGRALLVSTDVSSPDSVQTMVDAAVAEFGGIDVLVNNAAATGHRGGFLEVDLATWNRISAVNHTGLFITCQAVARVMVDCGGGSIINISSVNGITPQPGNWAYGATKGAMITLTRGMATELTHYGIRVNAIAPGSLQSGLPPDQAPSPVAMALMGRNGRPEEIASVAAFLASDDSSYMTGQVLVVDGGALVNGYNIYQQTRS
jgi:NAD(P)-dependent dehydrogenase (short-subunit alcohol dehydrogenase family)